jgi:hypothetical protein
MHCANAITTHRVGSYDHSNDARQMPYEQNGGQTMYVIIPGKVGVSAVPAATTTN